MNERVDLHDSEITAALKMLGDSLKKQILSNGKKSYISLNEISGALDRQLSSVQEMAQIGDLPRLIDALVGLGIISNMGIASILGMLRTKAIESTEVKK